MKLAEIAVFRGRCVRREVALVLNGSLLFCFMKMRCSQAKLTLWASTQCWEYADKPADGKSHTGDQTKHPRVWNFTTWNQSTIMGLFLEPRILADLENHDLSPTLPTYKASLIKPEL